MTIYSGSQRISEEEDIWRAVGIHEVLDGFDEQEIISGHMEFDNNDKGIGFYQILEEDYDAYCDLNDNKTYKYKTNNTYSPCSIIKGYIDSNNFYDEVKKITLQDGVVYYDLNSDNDLYYIYKSDSLTEIYYDANSLYYYYQNNLYEEKESLESDEIAILTNGEYQTFPYVEGRLINQVFYSEKVIPDLDHIYYDNITKKYYIYNNEEDFVIFEYEWVSTDGDQIVYRLPGETERIEKSLITGYLIKIRTKDEESEEESYKIESLFYKNIEAGYNNSVIPNSNHVYYDKLTKTYYILDNNQYQSMNYIQKERANNILYYHNLNNKEVVHSLPIIDGYFINDNEEINEYGGIFYEDRVRGQSDTIYHTTGTNNFWKYYDNSFQLYSLETNSYDTDFLYSNKITPISNTLYKDNENNFYYYDGSYHNITTSIIDGYRVPSEKIMCTEPITNFNENTTLYYDKLTKICYIYDGEGLSKANINSCYILNNIAYKKVRPALGSLYYDNIKDKYYTYTGEGFNDYHKRESVSNEDQIVLSLTKADMLTDVDILDTIPAYETVILGGPTSERAGIFTSDLYDRFIELESRYKLRISSTPYATLAELQAAAPTDTNCIYVVGGSEQYVLSDDDNVYVKIGSTDLSELDLTEVASVNDVNSLVDDISDVLEKIQTQDDNLQEQINTKYTTDNIITNVNNITESSRDAVSSMALIAYVNSRLSNTVSIENLHSETVVSDVTKTNNGTIQVIYKTIKTADREAYVDTYSSSLADANHAYSARLMKDRLNNLQSQITNMTSTNNVSVAWASSDPSDATIILSTSISNIVPNGGG